MNRILALSAFLALSLAGIVVVWPMREREAMLTPTIPAAVPSGTPISLPSSASPSPTVSAQSTRSPLPGSAIHHRVPFTAQAPFGQWSNPMFQDGCEEASLVMAARWVQGKGLTSQEAADEIIALSQYEQRVLGSFRDASAADTAQMMREYFRHNAVRVDDVASVQDLYRELAAGNILMIPMDGRALGNPHFTPPGPERHMLVVVGYDPQTKEFITNDPGTRFGEAYRYAEAVLMDAMLDYPTGDHVPIVSREKRMIVVRPA